MTPWSRAFVERVIGHSSGKEVLLGHPLLFTWIQDTLSFISIIFTYHIKVSQSRSPLQAFGLKIILWCLTFVTWHAVAQSFWRYAANRKIAGSRSDEVKGFFSSYLILPAALGPAVHSASSRNE
jgi:hypothetical protein